MFALRVAFDPHRIGTTTLWWAGLELNLRWLCLLRQQTHISSADSRMSARGARVNRWEPRGTTRLGGHLTPQARPVWLVQAGLLIGTRAGADGLNLPIQATN